MKHPIIFAVALGSVVALGPVISFAQVVEVGPGGVSGGSHHDRTVGESHVPAAVVHGDQGGDHGRPQGDRHDGPAVVIQGGHQDHANEHGEDHRTDRY